MRLVAASPRCHEAANNFGRKHVIYINKYEEDVRNNSRRAAVALCGVQSRRRGAAPLDSETRQKRRCGDRRYLIERGENSWKNDLSPDETHSRSIRVTSDH